VTLYHCAHVVNCKCWVWVPRRTNTRLNITTNSHTYTQWHDIHTHTGQPIFEAFFVQQGMSPVNKGTHTHLPTVKGTFTYPLQHYRVMHTRTSTTLVWMCTCMNAYAWKQKARSKGRAHCIRDQARMALRNCHFRRFVRRPPYMCVHVFHVYKDMGWLRPDGSLNHRSLLQKSPIQETTFCKRDMWF